MTFFGGMEMARWSVPSVFCVALFLCTAHLAAPKTDTEEQQCNSLDTSSVIIHWVLPVGCDFSGFFVEMLGFIVSLSGKVDNILVEVGDCSPSTLSHLSNEESAILKRAKEAWDEVNARGGASAEELARTVFVQHSEPCTWRRFGEASPSRPKVVVGRTMTERAVVDPTWVECCKRVDEVWVPTEWHRGVFAAAGVPLEQIYAMPEAIDSDFFQPRAGATHAEATTEEQHSKEFSKSEDPIEESSEQAPRLALLSVFKWEHRKGWDVLLDAYWAAFSAHDDVVLRLRTFVPSWEVGPSNITLRLEQHASMLGPNRIAAWRAGLGAAGALMPRKLSQLPAVEVVEGGQGSQDGALSRHAMRQLYSDADVFVLPTRGEGWGLPVVEAMAMGKAVIATNFSGPTAYLSDDNAFPLHFSLQEHPSPQPQSYFRRGGGVSGGLAEPSVTHLVQLLQQVWSDEEERRKRGRRARKDVVARLSSQHVGQLLSQRAAKLLAAAKT